MPRASTKIIGDKELQRALKAIGKASEANKVARPAIREAGAAVVRAAKANVPQESGQLKRSLGLRAKSKRNRNSIVVGHKRRAGRWVTRTRADNGEQYVEWAVPTKYAHLVEFGTAHSVAQPYLRPAWDSTDVKGIVVRRMNIELAKLAASKASRKVVAR